MDAPSSLPTCRRCGECCRNAGPGLHRADVSLVLSGRLPRRTLVTLRRGETVHDNVAGGLTTLSREMVRVGPSEHGPACPFFREPDTCLIHADRPAECRALSCAAPEALTAMYRLERLERLDLIPPGDPLAALVAVHEERCPAGEAIRLALASRGDAGAAALLAEMTRFDAAFRELCVTRGAVAGEELAFSFGRPLSQVTAPFLRGRATHPAPPDTPGPEPSP